jgi:galactonate dehydratase
VLAGCGQGEDAAKLDDKERAPASLGEGYLRQPFTLRRGFLDLPTKPGLGIDLDENALANKIGHHWRNPESYDEEDCAVSDW